MSPSERLIDETVGLACVHGMVPVLGKAHRHDDIELNMAVGGSLLYLYGGRRLEIPPGDLAVFWGALPHQLIACDQSAHSMHWLTIPLPLMVDRVPEGTLTRLLDGRPLLASSADPAADAACFRRWQTDLVRRAPELRAAMLWESQARICRLVFEESAVRDPGGSDGQGGDELVRRVATMASYIASHFQEPLSIREVAETVNLHPRYAMTLFRQTVGLTLGAYLTRYRMAEAQRLLLVTNLSVTQVAFRAGFGSLSRFYDQFTRSCGVPPGSYRHAVGLVPPEDTPRRPQALDQPRAESAQ